jgi:Na+-transporting methylmalonyl-CoA/oxaloacetate decarboxylase gamma subunit
MENPLATSLIVTGIGMAMLFAAMALLYGLMLALTALIKEREGRGAAQPEAAGEPGGDGETKRKVAAITVALARAELERGAHAPPRARHGASPWRQVHHHSLLNHPRDRGRGR